jgi:hypothetical protein
MSRHLNDSPQPSSDLSPDVQTGSSRLTGLYNPPPICDGNSFGATDRI